MNKYDLTTLEGLAVFIADLARGAVAKPFTLTCGPYLYTFDITDRKNRFK